MPAAQIVTIPLSLARLTSVDWTVDWGGQSAGEDLARNMQIVHVAFPKWTGNPKFDLRRGNLSAWRIIDDALRGPANVIRMPMIDPEGFGLYAAARAAGVDLNRGLSFSSGVRFSTGQGFAFTPFVLADGAASAGATELLVDESSSPVPVAVGQLISHDDWPCRVQWRQPEGSSVRLGLNMGLRAAIPDGDAISLQAYGRFRKMPGSNDRTPYGFNGRSTAEWKLVEYLKR